MGSEQQEKAPAFSPGDKSSSFERVDGGGCSEWRQVIDAQTPCLYRIRRREKQNFIKAFLREFYLSGSYKDCCNMKVFV